MASTSQTANFGLNQWAGSDPILREDFNADNLILEQALSERCEVKLFEHCLTEAQTTVTLDLSGYDLSSYRSLKLLIRPVFLAQNCAALMYINDIKSGYSICAANSTTEVTSASCLCTIPGSCDTQWTVGKVTLYLDCGAILSTCSSMRFSASGMTTSLNYGALSPSILSPEDMNCITFSSASGSIYPGSSFAVYACK